MPQMIIVIIKSRYSQEVGSNKGSLHLAARCLNALCFGRAARGRWQQPFGIVALGAGFGASVRRRFRGWLWTGYFKSKAKDTICGTHREEPFALRV